MDSPRKVGTVPKTLYLFCFAIARLPCARLTPGSPVSISMWRWPPNPFSGERTERVVTLL